MKTAPKEIDSSLHNFISTVETLYHEYEQHKEIKDSISREEYILTCLSQNTFSLDTSLLSNLYKEINSPNISTGSHTDQIIRNLIEICEIEEFSYFLEYSICRDFDTRMISSSLWKSYYDKLYNAFHKELEINLQTYQNRYSYSKICFEIDKLEKELHKKITLQYEGNKKNTGREYLALNSALRLISGEMKLSLYKGDPISIHISSPLYNEEERSQPFSSQNIFGEDAIATKVDVLKRISNNNPLITFTLLYCDDQSTITKHIPIIQNYDSEDIPIQVISLDSYFEENEEILPHLESKKSSSKNTSKKSGASTYALHYEYKRFEDMEDRFFVQIDFDNSIPIQNIGHHISHLLTNPAVGATQGTRKSPDSIRFIPYGDKRERLSYLHLEFCKGLFPDLASHGNAIDPNHGITTWRGNVLKSYLSNMHKFYKKYGNKGSYDVYPWQILRYIISHDVGLSDIPTVCLDSPHKSNFNGSFHQRIYSVFNSLVDTDIHMSLHTTEFSDFFGNKELLDLMEIYYELDQQERKKIYGILAKYPYIEDIFKNAVDKFSSTVGRSG